MIKVGDRILYKGSNYNITGLLSGGIVSQIYENGVKISVKDGYVVFRGLKDIVDLNSAQCSAEFQNNFYVHKRKFP